MLEYPIYQGCVLISDKDCRVQLHIACYSLYKPTAENGPTSINNGHILHFSMPQRASVSCKTLVALIPKGMVIQ